MASRREDDLAKRLAARFERPTPKGRVMSRPADVAATQAANTEPARPTPRAEQPVEPVPPVATSIRTTANRASSPRSSGRARRPRATSQLGAGSAVAIPDHLRRGAAGTALRGHLIPDPLHRQAQTRKVQLRATSGRRITWDRVMQPGLEMLTQQPEAALRLLEDLRPMIDANTRRRLVQATLPAELDRRLVELQLKLAGEHNPAVPFEQLWALAVVLWLRSTEA